MTDGSVILKKTEDSNRDGTVWEEALLILGHESKTITVGADFQNESELRYTPLLEVWNPFMNMLTSTSLSEAECSLRPKWTIDEGVKLS